jgi:predicted transporter
MNKTGRTLLAIGGGANLAIALLHLVIISIGPPAYIYFGAAELAPLAEQRAPMPALVTFLLALIFVAFGLYALSGAGFLRRFPLLAVGLIGIGMIYTLRGLKVIPEEIAFVQEASVPGRAVVFSAVSLFIGIAYLAGTILHWRYLRGGKKQE